MDGFWRSLIGRVIFFHPSRKLWERVVAGWAAIVLFFYCMYKGYAAILAPLSGALLISGIVFFFCFGNRTISLHSFFDFVRTRLPRTEYIFSLPHIVGIFLGVSVFFATIFAVILAAYSAPLGSIFSLQHFAVFEVTSLSRIIPVFLFFVFGIFFVASCGRVILQKLSFQFETRLELFLYSVAVGCIPLIFGTLALAACGVLYGWMTVPLLLLYGVCCRAGMRAYWVELFQFRYRITMTDTQDTLKHLVGIGLFFLFVIHFLFAFKPMPIDSDSLHTYFTAPYVFATTHTLTPFPLLTGTSNLGQNTEMLYALILSMTNASYLVHFSLVFFSLFLFGVYALAKRLFGERHALLSVITVYLVPWNFEFMYTNKVEFFFAFYSVALLSCLVVWYQKACVPRYLFLAGALSGVVMGIKYNAALLLVPVGILCVVVYFLQTRSSIQTAKMMLFFFLIALLFFAPWMAKNYIFFGNPLYPYSVFGMQYHQHQGLAPDPQYQEMRDQEIMHIRESWIPTGSSITRFVTTIWNQSVNRYYSDSMRDFGLVFLFFFPFGFLMVQNRVARIGLGIGIVHVVLWFAVSSLRPWYGFFGMMLFAALLPQLLLRSRPLSFVYSVFAVIVLVYNPFVYARGNIVYAAGAFTHASYLARNVSIVSLARTINTLSFAPGEKIYIAGDPRIAFFDAVAQRVIAERYYVLFGSWFQKGGEAEVYKNFEQAKIRYVLYSRGRYEENEEEWLIARGESVPGYLSQYEGAIPSLYEDETRFVSFLHTHAQLIYTEGDFFLFRIPETMK